MSGHKLDVSPVEKRPALGCEPFLEPRGAVAVDAGPGFGPVQIAATTASVRVLNLLEIEVLLPVLTLFGERRRAKADFHPLHPAIVVLTSRRHVALILAAGNRSGAKCAVSDRAGERGVLAGFDSRGDEITQVMIVRQPRYVGISAVSRVAFYLLLFLQKAQSIPHLNQ